MSEQTHKRLPDEPTNEMVNAAYHTWKHVAHPSILSAIRAMLKASWQAAPEVKVEPVAWVFDDEVIWHDSGDCSPYIRENGIPLYTHPQLKD
jgi:hypothetical protein